MVTTPGMSLTCCRMMIYNWGWFRPSWLFCVESHLQGNIITANVHLTLFHLLDSNLQSVTFPDGTVDSTKGPLANLFVPLVQRPVVRCWGQNCCDDNKLSWTDWRRWHFWRSTGILGGRNADIWCWDETSWLCSLFSIGKPQHNWTDWTDSVWVV